MRIYVTKYALAQGIFEIDAEIVDGYARQLPRGEIGLFLKRSEYATTYAEAVAQAEKKRIAKLKSLEKQMKKIGAIRFEAS